MEALGGAFTANSNALRQRGLAQAAEAGRLFRQNGNVAGQVRAGVERVYAYSRSFQPRPCLAAADPVIALAASHRYAWALGQASLERSMCAARTGDLDRAREYVQTALELIRKSGYRTLYLRAVGMDASLETGLGNYRAAWIRNCTGLHLFWDGSHPPMRAFQFYSDASLASEHDGSPRVALAMAREAADLAPLTGNRLTQAMALTRVASLAASLGAGDQGFEELEHARKLFDTLDDEPSAAAYAAESEIMRAAAYLKRHQPGIAAEILRAIAPSAVSSSLFLRLSYQRTQGLVRSAAGDPQGARESLEAAAATAESALANATSEHDRFTWQRDASIVYRELARLRIEAGDPQGALALWEFFKDSQAAGTPSRRRGEALPHLALRTAPGTSVIVYLQFENSLGIWHLDRDGVHFRRQPVSEPEVRALAIEFERACASPDTPRAETDRLGHKLYELLLGPVADLPLRQSLIVEPDGPIAGIPFEALLDRQGRYLGAGFQIASGPGVWPWARSGRRPLAAGSALVVATPETRTTNADFPPLPDAARESAAVRAAFPRASILAGPAATLASVKAALPSASLFHFSGHGIAGSESGGLVLTPADPGDAFDVLDGSRIAARKLACRLAVLSACSTAAGERLGPVDPDSLVRAFWRAGVPSVIASRWNVDDSATARLFEDFYATLAGGASVASSLDRAAARIRSSPATSHPYYWAAFHLYGRGDTAFVTKEN